ncbi:hypothetical protein ACFC3F_10190 [Microbacterium sp. NPDC055910]|uniref:hypothetical protein n=1 Tax=Microbacterium sp. NPDC055910 TaxID=3345659 RepID=UPI0035DF240E
METVTWSEPRRLARAALMGISVAFAGTVVSVFLGLGASDAHAATDDERGLTGAVTGLIGGTTDLLGATVSSVTSTASNAVEAIVDVAPEPVQKPVQAVGEAIDTTVSTVTTPVQQVVSGGVVSAVTAPVVEVLTEVPVVGAVVSGLGVDDVVTSIGAGVDDTLTTTVDAVSDVGAILVPAPTSPSLDEVEPPASVSDAVDASGALSAPAHHFTSIVPAAGTVDALVRHAASAQPFSPPPSTSSAVSSATDGGLAVPVFAGDPCPSLATTSGPAGAGSGAWALAALLPLAAHRAWVRRAGPGDDDAPPAPADPTDASPD